MALSRFRPPARFWLATLAAPLLALPLEARTLESSPAGPPAAIQDPVASEPDEMAALQARFDSLSAELDAAMAKFWEDYQAAAGEDEEVDVGTYPVIQFYPQFDELAEAGLPDAMFWTLGNMPFDQHSGYAAALERALVAAPDDDQVLPLLLYLHWSITGDGTAELAAIDRYIANGSAKYGLTARFAKARVLASHEGNAEDHSAAVAILEELSKISRTFPGQEEVVTDLFVLQHLGIGMLAPELVGVDVDGQPVHLSDYRGKVLVLDFWGFW